VPSNSKFDSWLLGHLQREPGDPLAETHELNPPLSDGTMVTGVEVFRELYGIVGFSAFGSAIATTSDSQDSRSFLHAVREVSQTGHMDTSHRTRASTTVEMRPIHVG
jgi:hypothetical protein